MSMMRLRLKHDDPQVPFDWPRCSEYSLVVRMPTIVASKAVGILLVLLTVAFPGQQALGQGQTNTLQRCNAQSPLQNDITAFQAKLSSPAVLVAYPTYEYTADLIPDGLSNGTEPVYTLSNPSFVVIPNTAEDVVASVQFAADHCLKLAGRGTGHQIAGLALPQGGMTINMQNFQNLSYDPTTNIGYVQMGNPSGNVDAALLPYNRLPIAGTCYRVGVAGFTLHGGNGWASMWHGAAADFVQSLDVVVVGADRKAVRKNITAESDPDLFFGFRGAGGNLGVVLAYTALTFPAPKTVQISYYYVSIDEAPVVLSWWSAFFAEAPVTIAPFVEFQAAGRDARYNRANILIGSYNVGPATNETETYFQELDAYLRPRSYETVPEGNELYYEVNYTDFATDEDFCGDLAAATYWNTYYLANDTLRTGDLPLDVIDTMVEEIKRTNSTTATFSIEASPTLPKGEAANYFTPNAWSFRDAYQIFVGDTWTREPGIPPAEQDFEKISWVKEASAALKPYTVGNYINQLMMEDEDDSRRSYEAGIFSRLTDIKATADPFNLFRDLNYVHQN